MQMPQNKGGNVQTAPQVELLPVRSRNWIERLWFTVADRGWKFAKIPAANIGRVKRARLLTEALLSERGEASGAAVSRELLNVLRDLTAAERLQYFLFLAEEFHPDPKKLGAAARAYLEQPGALTAAQLADSAEPPRQEVLRRINMAQGGTAMLVNLRKELYGLLPAHPSLKLLDRDMRHLFVSWFNRGFLELRRIDWQTSAAMLEKLITYEAVHEIQGWDDLRRRLAEDRRCFAFFHPALPGEPLIFVEVALVNGLANSVQSLLERDTGEAAQAARAAGADSAIFYSISNCQDGLRGIVFGNFLIKQVVEELREELPGIRHFATLSPVPRLRHWLSTQLDAGELPPLKLSSAERGALLEAAGMTPTPQPEHGQIAAALRSLLASESWPNRAALRAALQPVMLRLAAIYLTQSAALDFRMDPVARFHLGNGARLERINWLANGNKAGLEESYGIMVNYLYDPAMIEANHEAFVRDGTVAHSAIVGAMMQTTPQRPQRSPLRRLGA
jgi:malonyl-CoA decarboxylase